MLNDDFENYIENLKETIEQCDNPITLKQLHQSLQALADDAKARTQEAAAQLLDYLGDYTGDAKPVAKKQKPKVIDQALKEVAPDEPLLDKEGF